MKKKSRRLITIIAVGISAISVSLGISKIVRASNAQMFERLGSSFCLNAYQPGRGTNVNLWSCNPNDPDQKWERLPLEPVNNSRWMIRRVGSNFCLNAYQPGRGTNVNLWSCNPNDPDQHWEYIGFGEINKQMLRRAGSNFCLNAYRPGRGTNVNLWSCNENDPDQYWKNIPLSNSPISGNISLPFSPSRTWYVCQGYQASPTHQNSFALDLTVAPDFGATACWADDGNVNKSAGQPVLAPVAGTVVHVGADLVCLKVDDKRSLLIGHIDREVASGTYVSKDTQLGTVSRASNANGTYAHIHVEARKSPSCTPGTSVPFTAVDGFQFEGIGNLSNLPGRNDHFKRALTRP